ncbi:MAG: hypothetical protein IJ851_06210 [Eubacterium sp.]|nr:hypothetical protein [Eubacterium sp.]
MSQSVTEKPKMKRGKKVICIILSILIALIGVDLFCAFYHSSPESIIKYEADNRYISTTGKPFISAHRSGGGIAPEESMLAFKNCIENKSFDVDVFEFDLHITKDRVLVLLHDDTLDRTTDSREVFGVKGARPENYTYEELRELNIGARFKNSDGEMPYAELKGDDVPDELKIVRLENVLDYLEANGHYDYIIEIKNGGQLGKQGVDILCDVLSQRGLLDNVIFGTFKEEVSMYVDEVHPELKRSATIKEVASFYKSAMTNDESFDAKYIALQIPYNMPIRLGINLGTAKLINYAHSHNIAVQYWTINSESELEYLSSIGADCIMSDYPDRLYNVLHESE